MNPSGLTFEAPDANFEARVRSSFAQQKLMETIGATLAEIMPGEVSIELPFRVDLTQQHGYLHAGVVTSVVDSACGYAALTLMPEGAEVVSVEFKINLVAPAVGKRLIARGRVLRAGRSITVCAGDAYAVSGDEKKLVATMLATMMIVRGRPRDG